MSEQLDPDPPVSEVSDVPVLDNPVVDPELAPKTEPVLPPDAAGNPPSVFDAEVYQDQARKQQTATLWSKMVETEAQVRQSQADTGIVNGTDNQGNAVTAVIDDPLTAAKLQEQQQFEAERLRKVSTALLSANSVDELNLLNGRIRELIERKDRFAREKAQWEDFRDHPDHYGYVQLDGSTPINHEEAVASCRVMEAALQDVTNELDWYAAQPKE